MDGVVGSADVIAVLLNSVGAFALLLLAALVSLFLDVQGLAGILEGVGNLHSVSLESNTLRHDVSGGWSSHGDEAWAFAAVEVGDGLGGTEEHDGNSRDLHFCGF